MKFFSQMRDDRYSRFAYSVDRRAHPTISHAFVQSKVEAFEESQSGLKLVEMMIGLETSSDEPDFAEAKRVAGNIENEALKAAAFAKIQKAEDALL